MSVALHIAVDGPAASGKSVVCRILADRLHLLYLDTGVLYRCVAYAALRAGADPSDANACGLLAEMLPVELKPPSEIDGRQETILLDGRDITWEIRSQAVTAIVSAVAAHKQVRQTVDTFYRNFAVNKGVIMAGRDIAAVVLPEAQLKIFLTASLSVRAQRRAVDLQKQNPGQLVLVEDVLAKLAKRDEMDAPNTKIVPDALIIDSSELTIEQVVDQIVEAAHVIYR